MNPLPLNIRKNGFNYTQVLHEGRKYIYEQRVNEKLSYFEVFLAKKLPQQEFENGKVYPEREGFPNNEDFGKTAWSFRTLDEAMEKFNSLKHLEDSVGN